MISKKESISTPGIFIAVGVLIFAVMAGGFYLLLQESPDDVITSFFACGTFDKQLMYMTPDSARVYKNHFEQQAQSNLMTLDAFVREVYDRNMPKLVAITDRETLGADEVLYNLSIQYPKEEASSMVYVMVRVNGSWKIDIEKSMSYWK